MWRSSIRFIRRQNISVTYRAISAMSNPVKFIAPSSTLFRMPTRGVYRKGPPRDLLAEVAAAPDPTKHKYLEFYDAEKSDWLFFIPVLYKQHKESVKVQDFAFWSGEFIHHYLMYYEDYQNYLHHQAFRLTHAIKCRMVDHHGVFQDTAIAWVHETLKLMHPNMVQWPEVTEDDETGLEYIKDEEGNRIGFVPTDDQLNLVYKADFEELYKNIVEGSQYLEDKEYHFQVIRHYLDLLSDCVENAQRVQRLILSLSIASQHIQKKRLFECHEKIDELVFKPHNFRGTPLCKAIMHSGCLKAFQAEYSSYSCEDYRRTLAHLAGEGEAYDRVAEVYNVLKESLRGSEINEEMSDSDCESFMSLLEQIRDSTNSTEKKRLMSQAYKMNGFNDEQIQIMHKFEDLSRNEKHSLVLRGLFEHRPLMDASYEEQAAFNQLFKMWTGRTFTEFEHEMYPGFRKMRQRHRRKLEQSTEMTNLDFEEPETEEKKKAKEILQSFLEQAEIDFKEFAQENYDESVKDYVQKAINGQQKNTISMEVLNTALYLDSLMELPHVLEDLGKSPSDKNVDTRTLPESDYQFDATPFRSPDNPDQYDEEKLTKALGEHIQKIVDADKPYDDSDLFEYGVNQEEAMYEMRKSEMGHHINVQRLFDHVYRIGLPFFFEEEYDNPARKASFMVKDSVKEKLWNEFHADPEKNNHWALAKKFNLRADRIDAILRLKHLEKTEFGNDEPFDIIETKDGVRFGVDWQKFMEKWMAPNELPIDGIAVDFDGKPVYDYTGFKPLYDVRVNVPPEDGPGSGKLIDDSKKASEKGHVSNRHPIVISDLSDIKNSGKVNVTVRDKDGSLRHPDVQELKAAVMSERPLPRKVRERIRKEILSRKKYPDSASNDSLNKH